MVGFLTAGRQKLHPVTINKICNQCIKVQGNNIFVPKLQIGIGSFNLAL